MSLCLGGEDCRVELRSAAHGLSSMESSKESQKIPLGALALGRYVPMVPSSAILAVLIVLVVVVAVTVAADEGSVSMRATK